MASYSLKIILTCMMINAVFGVIQSMQLGSNIEDTIARTYIEEKSLNFTEGIEDIKPKEGMMSWIESAGNIIDGALNIGKWIFRMASIFFDSIVKTWNVGLMGSGTAFERAIGMAVLGIMLLNNYLLFKEIWLMLGKQRD